ncbi:peroxisomal targeting signal 2 receptor [Anaeramoeba flamelloides]|uniref:Peroxisomal targeting signal 2 receptor n=1 Tax=Anaeramoeba flamelloides TaxID=1746091 RepID=A0ABQ8YQD1_9EUKA|nr:peroxisomal targeting signal 2 receptor [Anaeramoeba flamelloides]
MAFSNWRNNIEFSGATTFIDEGNLELTNKPLQHFALHDEEEMFVTCTKHDDYDSNTSSQNLYNLRLYKRKKELKQAKGYSSDFNLVHQLLCDQIFDVKWHGKYLVVGTSVGASLYKIKKSQLLGKQKGSRDLVKGKPINFMHLPAYGQNGNDEGNGKENEKEKEKEKEIRKEKKTKSMRTINSTLTSNSRVYLEIDPFSSQNFLTYTNESLKLWRFDNNKSPQAHINSTSTITCCKYSPLTGGVLAIGNGCGSFFLSDTRILSLKSQYSTTTGSSTLQKNSQNGTYPGSVWYSQNDTHEGNLQAIGWSPFYPFVLATAGEDYLIKVWDIRNDQMPVANLNTNSNVISHIAWSNTHPELLVSASIDSTVQYWSLNSPSYLMYTSKSEVSSRPISLNFSKNIPFVMYTGYEYDGVVETTINNEFFQAMMDNNEKQLKKRKELNNKEINTDSYFQFEFENEFELEFGKKKKNKKKEIQIESIQRKPLHQRTMVNINLSNNLNDLNEKEREIEHLIFYRELDRASKLIRSNSHLLIKEHKADKAIKFLDMMQPVSLKDIEKLSLKEIFLTTYAKIPLNFNSLSVFQIDREFNKTIKQMKILATITGFISQGNAIKLIEYLSNIKKFIKKWDFNEIVRIVEIVKEVDYLSAIDITIRYGETAADQEQSNFLNLAFPFIYPTIYDDYQDVFFKNQPQIKMRNNKDGKQIETEKERRRRIINEKRILANLKRKEKKRDLSYSISKPLITFINIKNELILTQRVYELLWNNKAQPFYKSGSGSSTGSGSGSKKKDEKASQENRNPSEKIIQLLKNQKQLISIPMIRLYLMLLLQQKKIRDFYVTACSYCENKFSSYSIKRLVENIMHLIGQKFLERQVGNPVYKKKTKNTKAKIHKTKVILKKLQEKILLLVDIANNSSLTKPLVEFVENRLKELRTQFEKELKKLYKLIDDQNEIKKISKSFLKKLDEVTRERCKSCKRSINVVKRVVEGYETIFEKSNSNN